MSTTATGIVTPPALRSDGQGTDSRTVEYGNIQKVCHGPYELVKDPRWLENYPRTPAEEREFYSGDPAPRVRSRSKVSSMTSWMAAPETEELADVV